MGIFSSSVASLLWPFKWFSDCHQMFSFRVRLSKGRMRRRTLQHSTEDSVVSSIVPACENTQLFWKTMRLGSLGRVVRLTRRCKYVAQLVLIATRSTTLE